MAGGAAPRVPWSTFWGIRVSVVVTPRTSRAGAWRPGGVAP
jgi:hypothetical protein